MKELAWMSAVLVLWVVLNRWVLPWFGVPTCISGGCGAGRSAACGLAPPAPDAAVAPDAAKPQASQGDLP